MDLVANERKNFFHFLQILLDVCPKSLSQLHSALWNGKFPQFPWVDGQEGGQLLEEGSPLIVDCDLDGTFEVTGGKKQVVLSHDLSDTLLPTDQIEFDGPGLPGTIEITHGQKEIKYSHDLSGILAKGDYISVGPAGNRVQLKDKPNAGEHITKLTTKYLGPTGTFQAMKKVVHKLHSAPQLKHSKWKASLTGNFAGEEGVKQTLAARKMKRKVPAIARRDNKKIDTHVLKKLLSGITLGWDATAFGMDLLGTNHNLLEPSLTNPAEQSAIRDKVQNGAATPMESKAYWTRMVVNLKNEELSHRSGSRMTDTQLQRATNILLSFFDACAAELAGYSSSCYSLTGVDALKQEIKDVRAGLLPDLEARLDLVRLAWEAQKTAASDQTDKLDHLTLKLMAAKADLLKESGASAAEIKTQINQDVSELKGLITGASGEILQALEASKQEVLDAMAGDFTELKNLGHATHEKLEQSDQKHDATHEKLDQLLRQGTAEALAAGDNGDDSPPLFPYDVIPESSDYVGNKGMLEAIHTRLFGDGEEGGADNRGLSCQIISQVQIERKVIEERKGERKG